MLDTQTKSARFPCPRQINMGQFVTLALFAGVTFGASATACCEEPTIPDSTARAPILPAPLFRAPADEAEQSNAEEVRLLLTERNLGLSSDLTRTPQGFPELSARVVWERLSDLTYRPESSPGGKIAAQGLTSQLALFEWSSDGEQLIETQRLDYPDECTGGRIEWIDERYLLLRRTCAADLLLDSATGEWSDAGTGAMYFSNQGALEFYRDGVVTTAAGQSYAVDAAAACQRILFWEFDTPRLTARYVTCADGKFLDYRTGERISLHTPTEFYVNSTLSAIAPSAETAIVFDNVRNVIGLFDLTTSPTALLREIGLPESEEFRVVDWHVDDDMLLATMLYPGAYFEKPPCNLDLLGITGPAYVALLIDLAGGRVFQIDQLEDARDTYRNRWETAFLFRTRTD